VTDYGALSKESLIELLINKDNELREVLSENTALCFSEKYFRNLIIDSAIGIYRTTPSGEILFANNALINLMGFNSFEELASRNVEHAGYENQDYRDRFKEMMEQFDCVKGFESAWRKKDGTLIYIREYARAVRGLDGEIKFYEGTIEDITEKKKIEKVLKESLRKLVKTFEETVMALSATVEKRDPYTAGHQRRVAELAVAIAAEMGLAEDFVNVIRTASILHDIGKIYVPAEILSRPGKIKKEEFEMIKIHPEVGYEILKGISFDQPIAEIVYQHHEKLDGTGYPRGLKDKEILMEAKIISVADIMEALSSHRPYRPSFGVGPSLEEIIKLRDNGVLFASAVDACVRLFREKNFKFSE